MRRVNVEDFDIITLTVTSFANFQVDDSFSKAVNLSYVTVPGNSYYQRKSRKQEQAIRISCTGFAAPFSLIECIVANANEHEGTAMFTQSKSFKSSLDNILSRFQHIWLWEIEFWAAALLQIFRIGRDQQNYKNREHIFTPYLKFFTQRSKKSSKYCSHEPAK